MVAPAPPAKRLTVRTVDSASALAEAAWNFLATHPQHTPHSPSKLLLPGRFYSFRPLTRAAFAEKVASAGLVAILSPAGALCAQRAQFATAATGWPPAGPCRFPRCYAPAGPVSP